MFFECSGMARADSLPITQVVSSVREIRRRSDGHVKPGYDSHDLDKIKDFVETSIVLKKEKTGLGLCIVGGNDTHLGKVLVSAISPIGAAGKDGRLQNGDQILEVNDSDLRVVDHDRAVELLRMAKNPVRLKVYRENIERLFTNPNAPNHEFEIALRKGINDNLGLGIYARKDHQGVFITYITPGSLADASGLFQQGDRILTCNGKDLRTANQQDAVSFLKSTFGEIRILIGRNASVEESLSKIMREVNTEVEEIEIKFKEKRMRSRSDCMSMKSTPVSDSKRRTTTMNDVTDTHNGSTLELISYQADSRFDYENVNEGYCEDEPDIKVVLNDRENQWIGTTTTLKSTLKKEDKKGAKKKDHVSFEMSNIQNVRKSVFMYGDTTGT